MPYKNKRLQAVVKKQLNDQMTVWGLMFQLRQ